MLVDIEIVMCVVTFIESETLPVIGFDKKVSLIESATHHRTICFIVAQGIYKLSHRPSIEFARFYECGPSFLAKQGRRKVQDASDSFRSSNT